MQAQQPWALCAVRLLLQRRAGASIVDSDGKRTPVRIHGPARQRAAPVTGCWQLSYVTGRKRLKDLLGKLARDVGRKTLVAQFL